MFGPPQPAAATNALSAVESESSPEYPGLWFFGLDSSIYGNMHVRRRQARQLARAITRVTAGQC